ncbi:MAG: HAMP domain-containing protein [Deltaproteobacteria bacterium]|nr:HAMP domain-containing protein [Deltaproteobacteria bacterium]
MRLRTRLAIGFSIVAAFPLIALTFPARRALSSAVEGALAARLDGATRAAELALQDAQRESERAAQDLARSEPLESLAQAEHDGEADPAQAARLAESLMQSRGINVLEVLDKNGRVLSSGHLPGRVGDRDEQGLALAQATGTHLARLEVKTDDGIATVLAAVSGGSVEAGGTRLFVLAGKRLDGAFAQHLSELTGAEVAIAGDGVQPAASSPPLSGTRVRERSLPLPAGSGGPSGNVRLRLSAEGLYAAEQQLFGSVATLALLALAIAALLGTVLALRVTRPVDALALGAQALARGELGHRVEVQASGEVGDLVRTFNAMAGDLQNATERAALAERIAAWQEVARRLAHEVKNPLTPIRMSVETLQQAFAKKRPDFPEIFDESSKAIVEEVDRLKRIIDEFSRFARLPRPNLDKIDINDLVTQVLALYAGSKMQLDREAGAIPAVRADRDQLTQVLVNLLQNAEQAMPEGGRCTVRTGLLPSGEVALEVADGGPGIAEADRNKVFEPYFTTKSGGSGLGLAIVQRIVSEHGGRIEVGASSHGGASFKVVLPAVAAV